ncbi:hypothetical protein BDW02DRAFT_490105 [Decorospora gaudefroyi]|uniref:SprT-like domain-containing protein n=1 Tax=Decorospora gaudefroyi TaxID=184978 RepID=A0A6A5KWE0_9PLEO|nr:hypothetical protein BDW02DRAFT_490105 [Decorospora gaudefroyi]
MLPSEARATRSSPRKAALRYASSSEDEDSVLVPKSSRRMRDTSSSQNTEDSIRVPKTLTASDALTPRKQRILRPVESNSRLLRKLSDESLATPEKKQRERRVRSGTTDTDVGKRNRLLYTKSLARSLVKKQVQKGKIDVVGETEVQEVAERPRSNGKEPKDDVVELEEEFEEAETSLLCGEEEAETQETVDAQAVETSDEDEEPVVDARSRRWQPHSRRVLTDDEEEEPVLSAPQPVNHLHQPTFKIPDLKPVPMPAHEPPNRTSMRPPHRKGHSTISNWAQEVIDLTESPEGPPSFIYPPPIQAQSSFFASSRPTTSESNGPHAMLTYSPTPTKQRSPRKAPPISRPSTPPVAPPSPSKLVSPSKKKPVIPKAAVLDGRPSLDAFWQPGAVNEWTDRHSPVKPLVSPKKQKWREDMVKMMEGVALEDSSDEGYESPTTSPKKKSNPTSRSPVKNPSTEATATANVKQIRDQRKLFAERKHALAEAFLTELDTTITSGRITSLSTPTGGIKLLWSRTLKTTAGRANWRREQIRIRTGPDPTSTRTEIRHHCSIELAEKVIDDEERLFNVLAHEFCHLATFMISEVRSQPHGAEFKAWGRKASDAFHDRGVHVTTKHSYQIEYKFVWECVGCGYEFKRHSRSVDPARHSCGKCKGKLVQTKPAPRAAVVGTDGKREKSEYQIFVRDNYSRVKTELENRGQDVRMGKVMEAVAREYRERKGKGKGKGRGRGADVVDLEEALRGLKM